MNDLQLDARYWDQVIDKPRSSLKVDCWRRYMKSVYTRLMSSWFVNHNRRTLKTDLFEEAFTAHSLLPEMAPGSVGLDYSIRIVSAARRMLRENASDSHTLVCDLRNLPFISNCMEQILSPSSLDHFTNKSEIEIAIRELSRILKPGGVLILAMDNPQNPVVWVRNNLPFSWLSKIGLVPYYVGPTCTAKEAMVKLRDAGLEVTDWKAVAHVPRLPAIWLSMFAQAVRSERLRDWFYRIFKMWEILSRWPFRLRTGYYIAIRAVKAL